MSINTKQPWKKFLNLLSLIGRGKKGKVIN